MSDKIDSSSMQFWNSKPILKKKEIVVDIGVIKENYKNNIIANIPDSLKVRRVDFKNDEQVDQLICFLNKNYNKLNPNFFVLFDKDLLTFILGNEPMGICIETLTKQSTYTICGFIGGLIEETVLFNKTKMLFNTKIICIHKAYRKKNLSLAIIEEFTNYLIECCIDSSLFFSTKVLPINNAVQITSFYRFINLENLFESSFIEKSKDSETIIKQLRVGEETTYNYKLAKLEDIDTLLSLYKSYFDRFNIYKNFSKKDFENMLMLNCTLIYIVLNSDKNPIDFIILFKYKIYNKNYKILNIGHLYLYTANNSSSYIIVNDCLRLLKKNDIDLFIIDNSLQNNETLLINNKDTNISNERVFELNFCKTCEDKYLYMYNLKIPQVYPNQVGLFSF